MAVLKIRKLKKIKNCVIVHHELDLGGIPLRIKSALKTDKINFFSKLEKCSNLGSLKAKVNTRLRSNQVGIFGALDTHNLEKDPSAPKALKPRNFSWPPKADNFSHI